MPLTCVDIPDLNAAIVEAGGQEQLVLAELEAVPLDVDTAALLLGHRRAKGEAPHHVAAVDGVLARLTGQRGDAADAVLPRQTAHSSGALLLPHRPEGEEGEREHHFKRPY